MKKIWFRTLLFVCFEFISGLSIAQVGTPVMGDPGKVPPIIYNRSVSEDYAALCSATKGFSGTLTLQTVVELALCNSPQIGAAVSNIRVEEASLGVARSSAYPSSTVSLTKGRNSDNSILGYRNNNSTSADFSISWKIFDFGANEMRIEAQKSSLAASILTADSVYLNLVLTAAQLYYDAVAANAAFIAKDLSLNAASKTHSTASSRFDKGLVDRGDELLALIAEQKASIEQTKAKSVLDKSLYSLSLLIGMAGEKRVSVPAMFDDDNLGVDIDIVSILASANQHNPSIRAARRQAEAESFRVQSFRAESKPSVELGLHRYINGRPDSFSSSSVGNSTTVALTLTVPLFDGYASKFRTAGSEATYAQKVWEAKEVENQVSGTLTDAYADVVLGRKNIGASIAVEKTADLLVQSIFRRYSVGAVDIVPLLTAQTALADAKQERVRTMVELHVAIMRLCVLANVQCHAPGPR